MTARELPSDAFRLSTVTVVPSLNRLVLEANTIDLEPRVMGVLEVLAATPGEVVRRETLFERVWSDTVVNDEALTRAVSELRKVLGDDARKPTMVETIRGTGYRLLVPVEPIPSVLEGDGPDTGSDLVSARVASPIAMVALTVAVAALALAVWAIGSPRPPTSEPAPAPRFGLEQGEGSGRFPELLGVPAQTQDAVRDSLAPSDPETRRRFEALRLSPTHPDTAAVREFRRLRQRLNLDDSTSRPQADALEDGPRPFFSRPSGNSER